MSGHKKSGSSLVLSVFVILVLLVNTVPLNAGPVNRPVKHGGARMPELAQRGRGPDRQDRGIGRMQDRAKQARERFERMCRFLELTDQQKKDADNFFQEQQKEMRAIFQNARKENLSRDDVRATAEEAFKNYREKLEALLTDQQKEKLEEWRENRSNMGRPDRNRPGEAIFERLELNDSQEELLAQARKGRGEALRAIRERAKSGELSKEDAREAANAEREKFEASLAEFLSEEQQELLADQRARVRRAAAGRPGEQGQVGGIIARMKKRLELDEEQIENLRETARPYREKIGRIIRSGRERVRESVRSEIKNFLEDCRSLLTPGQQEMLDDFINRLEKSEPESKESEL